MVAHAGAEEKGTDTPLVKRVDGAGGAAMAVGSRAHLEAVAISRRAWYRNFLMHGFHFVVLLVAGGAVKDTQCGFKVIIFPSMLALLWLCLYANPSGVGSSADAHPVWVTHCHAVVSGIACICQCQLYLVIWGALLS